MNRSSLLAPCFRTIERFATAPTAAPDPAESLLPVAPMMTKRPRDLGCSQENKLLRRRLEQGSDKPKRKT